MAFTYKPHKKISGKQIPKACSKCDYIGDNFGFRYKDNKVYYSSPCRVCVNKMRLAVKKRVRAENPAKWYRIRRQDQLIKRYGISLTQYEELLELQQGVCALCGFPPTSSVLAVDHDHETNKIRAILCHKCNKGLGQFMDNPEVLRRAADYLEHWERSHAL